VAFIEFSFYRKRDIINKILIWMDSRRKSGRIGQEGGYSALGMTARENLFWFRFGRMGRPVFDESELGMGSLTGHIFLGEAPCRGERDPART
jgi:hypothetical protein